MSGRKRKKRHGGRPKSPKARLSRPRLDFLCDHDVERTLVQGVAALPGYTTTTLQILGLTEAHDSGRVKEKANELKAVILTRDGDYLDQINFRVCTHPGVLRIAPGAPAEWLPRLRAFLSSALYKRCRHAVVELRGDSAFIQSRPGGPIEEERYRAAGAE